MAAVVTYHAGVNAAARHQIAKFQQRVANEYYQLSKAITVLDKALANCERRMENLEILMTEVQNAQSQIVETDSE
jgi:prefoldin subunit 5